ncbi:MAG: prepilin-type N-terminal cleavage/methylation domain-containing protein [Desulfobulbales bacterium]|nr:prepilin-type N-terminal cleavage/methylation domain-containing protein [Desulfobulbales bacterium]
MNFFARRSRGRLFTEAGGFSLFEILAVLVILGIMAGTATPTVGRIFDNMRFRQQAEKFSAVLRYGKLMAVTRRQVVALRLGEGEECVFELSGAVDESRGCDLDEEDVLTMTPGEIFFYPQGTATPALLTFEKGERVKKIRLDLLTARPHIE